jgi:uncharacterized membrane protein YesL
MKGILSYDSKLMVMLGHLADTMLLNIMFLITCVPLVTVGAAFSALFAGSRAVAEQRGWFKAYWRAFRDNFLRATLVWLILLPVGLALAWALWFCWTNKLGGYMPAFICACVAMALVLSTLQMALLFYSRFEVGLGRLLKNGLLLVLSYPLRGLFIGITNWLPVLFFFVMPYTFQQLTIIWLFLYFGTAASLSAWLMKRPFETLIQDMEDMERAIEEYEKAHAEDE